MKTKTLHFWIQTMLEFVLGAKLKKVLNQMQRSMPLSCHKYGKDVK